MKIIDIAIKDLLHSLRSAFLLVMMFVAPLLITGLIYLAFGGLIDGGGGMTLPRPTVLLVNLDQPDPGLGFKAGELLAQHLAGPTFSKLLDARATGTEAAARQAVDNRQADVVVTIPPAFSAAAAQPQQQATVTLYHRSESAVAARVVKVIVSDFVDGFAGAKIAVETATHQLEARNLTLPAGGAERIAQGYVAWLQLAFAESPTQADQPATPSSQGSTALVSRPPAAADGAAQPGANQATLFLGPVMAGLMVFFMFFTGAAAAQSILYEDEAGTLARLFTTPTPRWAILAGKLLAVVVTLALQAVVLLAASALVFHIRWGQPASVALLTSGVVVAASGFGILLMSFIRTCGRPVPSSASWSQSPACWAA